MTFSPPETWRPAPAGARRRVFRHPLDADTQGISAGWRWRSTPCCGALLIVAVAAQHHRHAHHDHHGETRRDRHPEILRHERAFGEPDLPYQGASWAWSARSSDPGLGYLGCWLQATFHLIRLPANLLHLVLASGPRGSDLRWSRWPPWPLPPGFRRIRIRARAVPVRALQYGG